MAEPGIAPPTTTTSTTTRSGWWWAGPVLVVLGALLLVPWLTGLNRTTSSQAFAGATAVVFDLENAPISVVAGGDAVVVDADVTRGPFGARFEVTRDGDEVRVVQTCPFFLLGGWGCRASFEVRVPATATVTGSTSNGTIALTGLGAPADVRTSNGAITVADLSAPATVRSSNGAVRATGLTGESFQARTSNGRIEAAFAAAPRTVRLDTSNGAVEVVLPADAPAYAVRTHTSNGTVSADVRTDPTADRSLDVTTSNGSITLRYG